MEPPAITRRRRPFLFPVWLTLLGVLAVGAVGLALWASASNTMVLVVAPASGAMGSIDNPPLSAAGGQEAQRLAQRFATASGPAGLDAVYVGDTRRAEQTAAPLAQLLGLQPIVLTHRDAQGIASQVLHQHSGGTVLVICREAVITDLVRSLSGVSVGPAADRDMYLITIPRYGPARVLRMKD